MDIEEIKSLKFSDLHKMSIRILIELKTGERFYLIGGKDKRALPDGIPCISPLEMHNILNLGIQEDEFKYLLKIKEHFKGASIYEVLGVNDERLASIPDPEWVLDKPAPVKRKRTAAKV